MASWKGSRWGRCRYEQPLSWWGGRIGLVEACCKGRQSLQGMQDDYPKPIKKRYIQLGTNNQPIFGRHQKNDGHLQDSQHFYWTKRVQWLSFAPLKTTRLKKDVMSDLPEKMLCSRKWNPFENLIVWSWILNASFSRCLLFWTSNDCPLSSSEFYTTDNFINLWPVATPPVIPISAWDAGNLPRICKAQRCPLSAGQRKLYDAELERAKLSVKLKKTQARNSVET